MSLLEYKTAFLQALVEQYKSVLLQAHGHLALLQLLRPLHVDLYGCSCPSESPIYLYIMLAVLLPIWVYFHENSLDLCSSHTAAI